MKRSFVRVLYGIHDNSHRLLARRRMIDDDIKRIIQCKFNEPFKVYCYGEANYDMVKGNFDSVLVDKNPAPFDLIKYQYRNKLGLIQAAMTEWDEICFLDWDSVPIKPLPKDFWEESSKRREIQGCLEVYNKIKCGWRKEARRTVMNGGWILIRDKTIPDRAIKYWEENPQPNDEPAYMKLIDELTGGWKGHDYFWNNFETPYCQLWRKPAYPPELLKTKPHCFVHYL